MRKPLPLPHALADRLPISAASRKPQARERGGHAELAIFGDIGGDVTAAGVRDALRAMPAERPLMVRINSGGGSVFEGFAIYNMLARHAGHVTVRVDALAASMASLIAMAGNEIVMPGNSFLMLHNPWSLTVGDAGAHRDMAELLDKLRGPMVATYAARSGQAEAEVEALLDAETWLTAAEAVAKGFADRVDDPVDAAAAADLTRFHNVPHLLRTPKKEASSMTAADAGRITAEDALAIAARAKLPAEWALGQVSAGATLEAARDAAIDAVAAKQPAPTARFVMVTDEGDTAREAVTGYFAARLSGQPMQGPAEMYRGQRMVDVLADATARIRGVSISPSKLIADPMAMMTTGDLPIHLQNAGNRVAAMAYAVMRSPLVAGAEEIDLPDFRPATVARIGQRKPLDEVQQGGEVTYTYPNEAGEPIALAEYANSVPVTNRVLANDDLGTASAFMNDGIRASATRERLLLTGLLTAGSGLGPMLSDGVRWFDAARGNIATSAALDVVPLGAAIAAMRGLKDVAGQTIYGLEPGAIVVSPALEMKARQLVASLSTVSERADINPWQDLAVWVEPALSGNRWWIAPSPASRRCMTLAFLAGQRAPRIEVFMHPSVLGLTVRISHQMAAAVTDPMGWVTNAGG